MPQLEIEYSANLPITEQLRGLAISLHREIAKAADADLESFKTRLSPLENVVIADGGPKHGMVHLDVRLLSGRSDDVKHAVGAIALETVRAHLENLVGNFDVQFTVEVHDLDRANYHKHVTNA
ncbi:5-carboxymethyl-2-hydroxymuconate isomerase [Thalassospira sp. MBR-102]|uniref:5-carboxymethyl-2-hydroxymuconate isomerase n=1 Tax=Thalassospira xiamenensis M-5 = DSM 17429 TaxID=1123366 RepID=A0AB72U7T2_9PROT|nr:5-carboxymethyl-2-hydroxymuconate isomerase [Thalassospira xiamenensis]AJD50199.1 5-carboxymethyl-2-hydroxymuconate isomerase [Thalassospira xiamenensis M-5 = DSM 17429]PTB84288.1 5-carboxymethyl-2-hydroxymuconate isomerase [Marinobacter vinifirmus]RCK40618.1 5-carboxymethyl-2-hydroxymuconate isomerase [Thalassospira xiamenensis]SIT27499.1 5-carboxymethyl-2-hydroxymuconate isomerase [Thalassospira xiamenensis M-5 = DSM 17429]